MVIQLKKKISFLIDDKLVTDSLEVANGFNDFFVSIGPELAKNLVSSVNPLSYVKSNTNSIVIREVTYLQVRGVINSLNNSSLEKCMMNYHHLWLKHALMNSLNQLLI